jgi:Flp pilus assembly protein TadD
MNSRRPLVLALALATSGCTPDDQRTDTLDPHAGIGARAEMAQEVVAQLDSGSAAFRGDDFEAALAHYTRVTELDPENGPGWFGVYMAEDALGRADRAAVALERAQEIVPGATLLHEEEDTAR